MFREYCLSLLKTCHLAQKYCLLIDVLPAGNILLNILCEFVNLFRRLRYRPTELSVCSCIVRYAFLWISLCAKKKMERVHAKYFHAEKTPNKIVYILRLMHALVLNLAAGQESKFSSCQYFSAYAWPKKVCGSNFMTYCLHIFQLLLYKIANYLRLKKINVIGFPGQIFCILLLLLYFNGDLVFAVCVTKSCFSKLVRHKVLRSADQLRHPYER